jgi:hypothetical protein
MVINLYSILSGFRNKLTAHLERSALRRKMTMPLWPIAQPALPACPKIPDPSEKYGLAPILYHCMLM